MRAAEKSALVDQWLREAVEYALKEASHARDGKDPDAFARGMYYGLGRASYGCAAELCGATIAVEIDGMVAWVGDWPCYERWSSMVTRSHRGAWDGVQEGRAA